jgi:hypothetical protein
MDVSPDIQASHSTIKNSKLTIFQWFITMQKKQKYPPGKQMQTCIWNFIENFRKLSNEF